MPWILLRRTKKPHKRGKWFDGEIADKILTSDKLHKRFKLTEIHVDEEIYKEAQNTV